LKQYAVACSNRGENDIEKIIFYVSFYILKNDSFKKMITFQSVSVVYKSSPMLWKSVIHLQTMNVKRNKTRNLPQIWSMIHQEIEYLKIALAHQKAHLKDFWNWPNHIGKAVWDFLLMTRLRHTYNPACIPKGRKGIVEEWRETIVINTRFVVLCDWLGVDRGGFNDAGIQLFSKHCCVLSS
jgi:hypothetical protein